MLAFRVAVWFKNRKFIKMMIPTTRRIKVVSVVKALNPELSIDLQGPVIKELIIQEVEPDPQQNITFLAITSSIFGRKISLFTIVTYK